MFSGNYGEDGGLLGLGLVEIMRDFLVAIAFLGLFLIIAALSFYQKRKLAGSGLIKDPGDQEENLFLVFAGRTAGMLCCSVSLCGDGGNGSFVFLEKWVCCLAAGV